MNIGFRAVSHTTGTKNVTLIIHLKYVVLQVYMPMNIGTQCLQLSKEFLVTLTGVSGRCEILGLIPEFVQDRSGTLMFIFHLT